MLKIVKCRQCKTPKASGDICPGCAMGLPKQLMRTHKERPISIGHHGLHMFVDAPASYGRGMK